MSGSAARSVGDGTVLGKLVDCLQQLLPALHSPLLSPLHPPLLPPLLHLLVVIVVDRTSVCEPYCSLCQQWRSGLVVGCWGGGGYRESATQCCRTVRNLFAQSIELHLYSTVLRYLLSVDFPCTRHILLSFPPLHLLAPHMLCERHCKSGNNNTASVARVIKSYFRMPNPKKKRN